MSILLLASALEIISCKSHVNLLDKVYRYLYLVFGGFTCVNGKGKNDSNFKFGEFRS